MTPDRRAVERELTAPRADFEVVVEEVLGRPVKAYRLRHRRLGQILDRGSDRAGVHVVHGDHRLDFGHVVAMSRAVATGLYRAGLHPGDRVAVLAANNPEWISTFWGTVTVGGVLVGLNGWWSADEAIYGLRDCGARVLVVDEPRYERIKNGLAGCEALEQVYVIGTDSYAELVACPPEGAPEVTVDEDDPAVILYTSGTTGRPRGAVHTHRGVIANSQNIRFSAAVGARLAGQAAPAAPTALVTVPFFHVSGCHAGFVAAMDRGSTVVLPTGRFDPEQVLALIEAHRVTQWSTVPTMVQRVVDHMPSRGYDLSSLAAVGYGGAPSGAELQRRARTVFPGLRGLHIGYGLTETCGAVTINSGAELERAPEAAGRALPIVEVRIDPGERPAGGPGEVQVRGSQLMAGYWPLGSESPITDDGWLSTGDIGYVDAEGLLRLTDRAKDVIIRGGENVYCAEIENRLADHPAITEAAVIGIPHPSLGEEVGAVVLLRPGSEVGPGEVRDWVGAALAHFKVPSALWISDRPLPRNAAGKLIKAQIKQSFLTTDSAAQDAGQL